jgi:hypothetical protein
VAVTAAIAVVTGAAGWFAGTLVRSPADAAAAHRPPPPSLITVAVQERTLTASVTTQGTVAYGAPKPLTLTGLVATGADAAAAPIVTKAPVAGRTLREGDVLLEVSGRPVLVLVGTVPMYRTLTRGSAGDDVQQVRRALRRLLPQRRVARTGALDGTALDALGAWYDKRGYSITGPSAEHRARLRTLEAAVRAAPDDKDAASELADFRKTYGKSVPSGEILFLPRLPVRLTASKVQPGAPAAGEVGTVADPALVINGTVSPDDAVLIKVGMRATLSYPGGRTFAATVSGVGGRVKARGTDTAGVPVRLKPTDQSGLVPLVGEAVKVSITVGGTGHRVLSVPVAAVFTASDGGTRVTVRDPSGQVRDVPVETGLSTGGYVQITSAGAGVLKVGSLVVVGER